MEVSGELNADYEVATMAGRIDRLDAVVNTPFESGEDLGE